MPAVAVDLDPEHAGPVAEALLAAGFAVSGEAPWARVVEAKDATFEDVGRVVGWVLEGGVLGICGGTGPLLAALHLTPGEEPVEGPVESAAPDAPSLPLAEVWPVTGVGYALYRAQGRCVGLAGRRGGGWVAYALDPGLLAGCLSWIASRGRAQPVP